VQFARACVGLDFARDAMRAEHRHSVGGHVCQLVHEHGALGLQAIDHGLVMHDLMPHIDWRAVLLQRTLHDLDGTHDRGTEAVWLGQDHPQRRGALGLLQHAIPPP
jgi:hypothetical protein